MAGRTTKTYKNTFSGSVGAGMGSLFSPNGRKYYILEHKVSSKYHKAGESQEIIVDNIELGRDPRCQVRFDEKFQTVSRHHAGIVKDGDMWKLVQISKKNSTFLNGRPIKTEWYLQSGDEIQLAVNGPKLGFIIPTGKKSTIASIGLTRRLSLFRQQALRPYKYAIASLSCVLILAVSGLGTWNYFLKEDLAKQSVLIAQQIDALSEQKNLTEANKAKADSLAKELVANNKKMGDYEEKMGEMAKETERAKAEAATARRRAAAAYSAASKAQEMVNKGDPDLERQCFPFTYAVYQVRQQIRYPNGEVKEDNDASLVGSGFLLADGRFITARHVTETYYYYFSNWGDDKINQMLTFQNVIVNNGGDIQTTFVAINHAGKKITFTNKQCNANRAQDATKTININGTNYVVKAATVATTDWVSYKTSGAGAPFDNTLSANMNAGTHLKVFGFPLGRGGENPSAISPIFSSAEVARKGLDVNGTIMTSNTDTQSGNSGGPVFTLKEGTYNIVGILSGSTAGKGRIVPIQCAR